MRKTTAVIACAVLAGCMKQTPETHHPTPTSGTETSAMAPQPVERATDQNPSNIQALSDADIKKAVEREFLYSEVVGPDIKIHVTQGIVQLTGQAKHLLEKERAAVLATTVRGVRSVANRVQVQPITRSDEQIRKDIEAAVKADPVTESWDIAATVDNGKVILSGEVESYHERLLGSTLAKQVKGVRSVQNRLDVTQMKWRADKQIAQDVKSRLKWDAMVPDSHLIEVQVQKGKVHLAGTVGSAAQKQRATFDAFVLGAKDVDASKLKVNPQVAETHRRNTAQVTKPDAAIEKAIKDALLYDPRVSSLNVTPKVAAGIVTLTGTVPSLRAKQIAQNIGRYTLGVNMVVNRLKVQMKDPVKDAVLAAEIEAGLFRNPITESHEIDTAVSNGKVTLSGQVDGFFERAEAEAVALAVPGVTQVDNEIKVERPTQAFVDEPYDPFYPDILIGTVYAPPVPGATGDELEQRVRYELLWDPHVDAWQVDVNAQQGRVTLTGTVDSLFERTSAEANAFEAGATLVNNKLAIR